MLFHIIFAHWLFLTLDGDSVYREGVGAVQRPKCVKPVWGREGLLVDDDTEESSTILTVHHDSSFDKVPPKQPQVTMSQLCQSRLALIILRVLS